MIYSLNYVKDLATTIFFNLFEFINFLIFYFFIL